MKTNKPVTRALFLAVGLIGSGALVQAQPTFNPNPDNWVFSVAAQPDQRILVGGSLSFIGGEPHYRLARVDSDGAVDSTFNPSLDGSLRTTLLQANGKIIVGGTFVNAGGVTRNRVARFNSDGSLDAGFNPDANATVLTAVEQANGKVLLGGDFTSVSGVVRNHFARLHETGALDTTFNPNVNGSVYTAAVQSDGKIIIGGLFTSVGGVARAGLARLNQDGTLDPSFAIGANGNVVSLALQADGKILVGGIFTTVGGVVRNRLARLNGDGTLDVAFNPNVNDTVFSVALQADGRILITGGFTTVGGLTRNRIARLNGDGSPDSTLNPGANDVVYGAALQVDGKILLVGSFTSLGGVPINRMARLDNVAVSESFNVTTTRIEWLRGGASPETQRVLFELSTDGGSVFTPLGAGTRIAGGWELTGLTLPRNGMIRARAATSGGMYNASSGWVETIFSFWGIGECPAITLSALPNGALGSAYAAAVTASPAGAYTYFVVGGSLPPGLFFDPQGDGHLSGTPAETGVFAFDVIAIENTPNACWGVRQYQVQITSGGPASAAFEEDFSDNSAGWTLGTEWQIGPALAGGGGIAGTFGDPEMDTTTTADNGIAGMVIGGNITTALHPISYLTSPPVDTTSLSAVDLSFERWLNSDYQPYMDSRVEVWNGSAWVLVWQAPPSAFAADSSWVLQHIDITAYSNPQLRVRFGTGVGAAGAYAMSGWNIDDVRIGAPVLTELVEDFSDNSAGWTLGDEWQIGPALAGGGGIGGTFPDPASDTTPTADNGVAGMVIGGNISTTSHPISYLTSPTVDTTSMPSVELSFERWLNSDYQPYMDSRVEVWDGTTWVMVWQAPPSAFAADSSWVSQRIDITAYSNPQLRVRFGTGVSAGAFSMSGWNIDDVRIGAPSGSLRIEVVSVENGGGRVSGSTYDPISGLSTPFVCEAAAGSSTGCDVDARPDEVVFIDAEADPSSVLDGVMGCGFVANSLYFGSCPAMSVNGPTTVTVAFRGPQTLTFNVASVEGGQGTISAWITSPVFSTGTPFACEGVAGVTISCATQVRIGDSVMVTAEAGSTSVLESVVGCSLSASGLYSGFCDVGPMAVDLAITAAFRGPQTLTFNVDSVEGGQGTLSAWILSPVFQTATPFNCEGVAGAQASCTTHVRIGDSVMVTAEAGSTSVLESVVGCSLSASGLYSGFCDVGPMAVDLTITAAFRGPQTLTFNVGSVEGGQGTLSAWILSPVFQTATPFDCEGVAGAPASCTTQVRIGDSVMVTAESGSTSVLESVVGCSLLGSSLYNGFCDAVPMGDDLTITAAFRGPQTLTFNVGSVEGGQGTLSAWILSPVFQTATPFNCEGVAGAPTSCTTQVRIGDSVIVAADAGSTSVLDSLEGCSVLGTNLYGGFCDPLNTADDLTITTAFRGPQTLTLNVASPDGGEGTLSAWIFSPIYATGTPLDCLAVPGTPTSCSAEVRIGDEVSISALPQTGSFVDTVTGCTPANPTPQGAQCDPFVMTPSATTVSTTFRIAKTMTVTFGGAGSGVVSAPLGSCPSTSGSCVIPIALGANQILAQASPTSDFQSWSGACAGQGALCEISVIDDLSVVANFGPKNHPPVAVTLPSFVWGRNIPITFDGSSSYDPDGDPLTYSWTFGDGTTGTGVAPVHSYATNGAFTVSLFVNDGKVDSPTVSKTVTITNTSPVAVPGGPYSAYVGQPKVFNGAGSSDANGDPLTYSWYFAGPVVGGPSATGAAPSKVFTGAGTFTVGLQVNDGAANSQAASTTVLVRPTNPSPIAVVGGPYVGTVGQPLTLDGGGSSDLFGDPLTYVWNFGDGTTGTGVSPIHTYATSGVFTVSLCVNDGVTSSSLKTTTAAISNNAPTATAGGPYSGARGAAVSFAGSGADPDGDTLTYSWNFGDGATASGANVTHAYATLGTFTATLTTSDGVAVSPPSTATVTIANQAPTANAGGPYSGVRNVAITFAGSGSADPDGDPLTYAWDFGDGATATGAEPSHAYAANGTFTATLTVNDGSANSTPAIVMVTIVNQVPTANAGGPYSGVRNVAIAFAGSGSGDPDGDPLTYAWDFGDGATATGAAPTHAYAATGAFTVTLTVNDGAANSAVASTSVIIANRTPSAHVGGPYAGVRNQAIAFTGAASTDADGDPLSYAWEFGDGATGTGAVPTHAYTANGTFTVTLTVNDGATNSAPASTTVTIVNQNPTANAGGPYTGVRNAPITFTGAGSSDPDGDALGYSWDFGDGGTATGVSPAHAYTANGTFTVTLTVNDGAVNSAPASTAVTIVNQNPTANAGGPYTGVRNAPITFTGAGSSDPDGDALTYSWDFGDGSAAGIGVAPTHAYTAAGTFTVTLSVNDGAATSAPSTTTVTIANRAPVPTIGYAPASAFRAVSIAYSGTASTDPDGDALSFAWDFGDGATATGPTPSHAFAAVGSFTVTLTVSDGTDTTSASRSIEILNRKPIASIPFLFPYRNVPQVVSGAQCWDQDGDPMTYRWDFGDGTTSTEASPSHAFAALGDFTISLVVNDGFADSDVVTRTVTVQNSAPYIVNTSVQTVGYRNTAINVSAVGQDDNGDPLTYAWTFGDGATASGISASHSYAAVGTYTVSATVSDGIVTSSPRDRTISIVNRIPLASVAGPYSGTRLAPVVFDGRASSDGDGDPMTYLWDFGDGATATGPTPSHLYTSAGTFTVTLIVNDGLDSSAPKTTAAFITNVSPTVTLTAPAAGALAVSTASVTLAAAASDPDGSIAKVEFFVGGVKVGESTAAPFSAIWPSSAPGWYSLTARATDSNGATATSSAVSVYRDSPPSVTLTAPADNAQYAAPASITLSATASDADGTVVQVQFFRGTTSLGIDTTSPYSVVWTGATAGTYTLTAVATDNLGAVVSSTPITVKVTAALAPVADSYVRASNGNSNFGTATTITVQQGSSNSSIRWTYMKFDLSSVPTIANAKVRVFGGVSATTSASVQTAVYPATDTSWTETGLTWNNKPASGATALSSVAIVSSSTSGRWYELDVTTYLQAEKAAGRNVVTLVLKNVANSTPFVTFSSKENATVANRPQVLVVP